MQLLSILITHGRLHQSYLTRFRRTIIFRCTDAQLFLVFILCFSYHSPFSCNLRCTLTSPQVYAPSLRLIHLTYLFPSSAHQFNRCLIILLSIFSSPYMIMFASLFNSFLFNNMFQRSSVLFLLLELCLCLFLECFF